MTFDRETFELVGALAGFLGLVISVGSVLYARRQAIAAEGPRSPQVEIAETTWRSGHEGWLKVAILTRNHTSEGWDMDTAKVEKPGGSLLIAGTLISETDSFGNQVVRIPAELDGFSSVTKPWTDVLPPGSGPRHPMGPNADRAREDLYLRLPPSAKSFKLSFAFKRKSGIGGAVRVKVIGSVPNK